MVTPDSSSSSKKPHFERRVETSNGSLKIPSIITTTTVAESAMMDLVASFRTQLSKKEQELLEKDKRIAELKSQLSREEREWREKLTACQKDAKKEEEKKKREQERKKKEEDKEQEKRKKEEERIKKEEEKRKKDEERRKKEEERRKKEEERKMKEEERKMKEEERKMKEEVEGQKKARVAESFLNFFKRVSSVSGDPQIKFADAESSRNNSIFKPFQLQANQTLADYVPSVSRGRFDPEYFQSAITPQSYSYECLYISQLKTHRIQPHRYLAKAKKEDKIESTFIIDEPLPKVSCKAKYFDLSDIRPPYYGTWRKRSKIISGRKPWAKDAQFLDYDNDSEEEWDAEEEGESIVSSGSDTSRNGADDFEIDDFCVPHGHLSGDEEVLEEEEDNDEEDAPKKHVTLIKEEDLLKARSKKVCKLNPVTVGPFWMTKANKHSDTAKLLEPFKFIFNF